MRPILMLNGISNLHDARYCAAVGIGMLGFRLGDENALKPEAVLEIVEWLSGPEAIAEFGEISPSEMLSLAKTATVSRIRIPSSMAPELPAGFDIPLVFDLEIETESAQIGVLANHFPDALFVVSANEAAQFDAISNLGLWDRSLVICEKPDEVWKQLKQSGMQPHGFVLGSFIDDEDGQIDYDICDSFIEKYEALVLA